ncbi:hypothetical protein CMU30_02220 [Elizabethkingia anophelis]|nr:hypothetical protein [Elizabethkingia anophelis]MDV3682192.1 hypothetical protein [Elizabethkingia anophelis]MDV3701848.1 hypothetical protein [Elizabethkingia anophelis]MDV3761154.1 hypothetical protein [Elizabethkingia anophelis]MDV3800350.1 hypothetical protein [Elizabethkingia anophelis]
MKKTLFFLVLSTVAFGQEFKQLDSIQFQKSILEFASATGKTLKYSEKKSDLSKYESNKTAIFTNPENDNEQLLIVYQTSMSGANINLEIKGTKQWNIRSISGKYLMIFPIWKKYMDRDADLEKTANTKQVKKLVGNYEWSLSDYGSNIWVIKSDKYNAHQSSEYIQLQFEKTKKGYEFKTPIKYKELEERIKIDFVNDSPGNYTAFYDVLLLDSIPDKIKLKARLNR